MAVEGLVEAAGYRASHCSFSENNLKNVTIDLIMAVHVSQIVQSAVYTELTYFNIAT
jgi:hypothetical protein